MYKVHNRLIHMFWRGCYLFDSQLYCKIVVSAKFALDEVRPFDGRIVNPIVLGLIYFGSNAFFPVLNLTGRDELKIKTKHKQTYWIKRLTVNRQARH